MYKVHPKKAKKERRIMVVVEFIKWDPGIVVNETSIRIN